MAKAKDPAQTKAGAPRGPSEPVDVADAQQANVV